MADAAFGGPDALAAARAALADRGVRLILDYVPNHVAPDHPWVTSRPELFVRGDEDDIKADPGGWLAVAGNVLAHGRDPYFPPWPDVVQLDAFSPALRAATADTLADIASQCDGIRCDMAMLLTNQVFARTWGSRVGPEPAAEFWPEVLGLLHARHPQTVLIAEAYWDMEWPPQQQWASTSATTSGSMTGSSTRTHSAVQRVTCRPISATSPGWCVSWRTMTSRASPAACPQMPNGPRP